MATKASIAITLENAIESLKVSSAAISKALQIESPDLDIYFHDKDLQHAEQLKALAAFDERVQVALSSETAPAMAGKKKGVK